MAVSPTLAVGDIPDVSKAITDVVARANGLELNITQVATQLEKSIQNVTAEMVSKATAGSVASVVENVGRLGGNVGDLDDRIGVVVRDIAKLVAAGEKTATKENLGVLSKAVKEAAETKTILGASGWQTKQDWHTVASNPKDGKIAGVTFEPSAKAVAKFLDENGQGMLEYNFNTGIKKDAKHTYVVKVNGVSMDGGKASSTGMISCEFAVRANGDAAVFTGVACTDERFPRSKLFWNDDGLLVWQFNAGATQTWMTFAMTTTAGSFPTVGDTVCKNGGPSWMVAFDNTDSCAVDQRMTDDIRAMPISKVRATKKNGDAIEFDWPVFLNLKEAFDQKWRLAGVEDDQGDSYKWFAGYSTEDDGDSMFDDLRNGLFITDDGAGVNTQGCSDAKCSDHKQRDYFGTPGGMIQFAAVNAQNFVDYGTCGISNDEPYAGSMVTKFEVYGPVAGREPGNGWTVAFDNTESYAFDHRISGNVLEMEITEVMVMRVDARVVKMKFDRGSLGSIQSADWIHSGHEQDNYKDVAGTKGGQFSKKKLYLMDDHDACGGRQIDEAGTPKGCYSFGKDDKYNMVDAGCCSTKSWAQQFQIMKMWVR